MDIAAFFCAAVASVGPSIRIIDHIFYTFFSLRIHDRLRKNPRISKFRQYLTLRSSFSDLIINILAVVVQILLQHLWWAVRDGLPAALLLAAFLLWALLTRRFAAAGGVAALAAGLAATSLMGGYLVYYGLVLAVFAPLGLVPLVRLAEKTPAPVRTALPWAVLAACAAVCYALTPNRALRGRARADLPQYRFAAQINGGSLLNYGTLDGGFYTAAGVLPPCKYFCVTNMPLNDQWTDQQAVLKAGAVDYVVALTGDLHGDFPQYAVIDRCSYDGGVGEVIWYLYQLQR